ncbi:MAG: alpha/beta hydrolase [Acinetobacter sp.]|jgi:pimeloyl-ACP methyl ester carboxylesterase|nr:MAG: alpha/beta hydrolase [Acinetobacter sp.]
MTYYTMPDNEKLYVREIGQGKARPVLILSGLGMSSWQWLPFILPSLNQRRFIIPDYRGFAGSKHCKIPQHLNTIESHWQDIDALLKQLNLKEIDVIAYSMGATTTMHGLKYANFAQKIRRYLHIDQTAKIKNDTEWRYGLMGQHQDAFLNLMQQMITLLEPHQQLRSIAQLPPRVQAQLNELWLSFMQIQNPDSRLTKLLHYLPSNKWQTQLLPLQSLPYILWYLRSYLQHDEDYRTALAALDKPTHFIIGKQSALYDMRGQLSVAEQLKNAHIQVFAQSGHMPLVTEPFQFTKVVNRFLSG